MERRGRTGIKLRSLIHHPAQLRTLLAGGKPAASMGEAAEIAAFLAQIVNYITGTRIKPQPALANSLAILVDHPCPIALSRYRDSHSATGQIFNLPGKFKQRLGCIGPSACQILHNPCPADSLIA